MGSGEGDATDDRFTLFETDPVLSALDENDGLTPPMIVPPHGLPQNRVQGHTLPRRVFERRVCRACPRVEQFRRAIAGPDCSLFWGFRVLEWNFRLLLRYTRFASAAARPMADEAPRKARK